jgi:LruC domain-containing protein
MINYLIEERTSGRGNVRFINFDIYYSIDGAEFNNGFYIKLPFDETMIALINFPDSLSSREGFDYYYDTGNGGDGNIVLRFFESGQSFMPDDPSPFHNTEEGSEFTEPIFFSLNILLFGSEEYINRPLEGYPPYNPFLVINQEMAREVHFGNYPPTSNINIDYFGTEDDTSDPIINRYFLTSIGLP